MSTKEMTEIVSRRLKCWRKQQGRTAKGFAQDSGMSLTTVSRVENGQDINVGSLIDYISGLENERAVFRELFDFSPEALKRLEEDEADV